MLPELGHILLIAGVATSFVGALIPALSLQKTGSMRFTQTLSLSRLSAVLTFCLILASTAILARAFIYDDFSVAYIAQHSNSDLPDLFKIAALWGGHEGSFLFMLLALSGWNALLALGERSLPLAFKTATISVLSAIVVLLGVYCLWLSNPFFRQSPIPLEGRDLNPMLQDIGLIFHPPLLYLGYIGFAVPFAFSLSALMTGTPAAKWVNALRRWTASAWAFLTAGIVLGSWWAYKELGWGGWWFWDPVENASLLPWLTGTALLHCLIAVKRENALIGWSLLLCILTFPLSILGTFIVRSGVLISVHAFASDPLRGTGLLLILLVLLLSSLLLFALKAPRCCETEKRQVSLASQAFLIMCGAALLVSMMLIVMLGTFYPLIYASFGLGTLSVGAPYFNSLFVPMALTLGLLAAFTFAVKSKPIVLLCSFLGIIALSAALTFWLSTRYMAPFSFAVMLSAIVAFCLVLSALKHVIKHKAGTFPAFFSTPMSIGHTGLALVIISTAVMSEYSDEISLKMQKGSSVTLGPYTLVHEGNTWHVGPNYTAERVSFLIGKNGIIFGELAPEKRHYTVRTMSMSEVGILRDGLSDLYVTLGNKFDANTYAVRVQFKPLVNLLWIGGALLTLSGFLSALRLSTRRISKRSRASLHALAKE